MLLGESDDPRHLIPLGDPSVSRVVVGRSVPFDRTRIKEVSRVLQTGSFHTLTMHVAVKGILSLQHPARTKYPNTKL